MAFLEHVASRLTPFGIDVEVKTNEIVVTSDGMTTKLKPEREMAESFDSYRRARRSVFDTSDWSYTHNSEVEIPLVRLDTDVYRDTDEIEFSDAKGNTVCIHRASQNYMFAHFESTDYERYFEEIVKNRLSRKVTYARSMNILFRSPVCATYSAAGRKSPTNLQQIALERIRACLTKLAIERHACYEIAKPRTRQTVTKLDSLQESDWQIPRSVYEPNLVNYYKAARSSPFASQSFLAYYHVLEYYFLRVAEDLLHHQLKAYVNRTDFRPDSNSLDRLISLVRRHDSSEDETDMLRRVLQRFIAEEDFIQHINQLEYSAGEKLYTKRKLVFGEQLEISPREGHALSNTAKALKHIRNAIVHSSDRYKREECHIPLTDSEHTIAEYIPILKYLAEQVIYGTASASSLG